MFSNLRWIVILTAVLALILSACAPEDGPRDNGIPGTGEDEELISTGEMVYTNSCAGCHSNDGAGVGAFPPLDGNPVVVGDPAPVIEVTLHGREAMPPFEGVLTDFEVAAVVSYIRNAWTNDASVVTEDQVQELR
jgi:cytochrome c oxidase subunit II